MASTFLIALVVAVVLLAYWRVVLIVVGALIIALLVTGVSVVTDGITGRYEQHARYEPAPAPDAGLAPGLEPGLPPPPR